MFTLIVIIAIIWFFISASSSASSSNQRTNSESTYKPPVNSEESARYARGSAPSYNSTSSGSSYKPTKSLYDSRRTDNGLKCSKCKHIHYSQTNHCKNCGWDISIKHINLSTNLSGVTFEGRQSIIARTSPSEPIMLRRDPHNAHDRNAVGVYNSSGKSLGWVPKGYAANIAPLMDKGIKFYAKIKRIVGGDGYHYGIEVRLTNDPSKVGISAGTSKANKNTKPPEPPAVSGFKAFNQKVETINSRVRNSVKTSTSKPITNAKPTEPAAVSGFKSFNQKVETINSRVGNSVKTSTSKPMGNAKPTEPASVSGYKAFNQKVETINSTKGNVVISPAATAVKNKPAIEESVYLDTGLLGRAGKEDRDEVLQVLADFEKFKKAVLPTMNRKRINELRIRDLESTFDSTIMLAGGRESNYVHRYYKAIMVQLAFQLGFLIHRLSPESYEAKYAQNKMNWLSTMDVKLETQMLQGYFNQSVIIRGESPIVYDSYSGSQIRLWDIDEISYVLGNLSELGFNFKKYLERI